MERGVNRLVTRPIRAVGRGAESVARHAGSLAVLFASIVRSVLRGGVRGRDVLNEAYLDGRAEPAARAASPPCSRAW